MWHVVTNVAPWTDAVLERIDACLVECGSRPLSLPLGALPLEEDGDHFTRNGQRRFHRMLAEALSMQVGDAPLLVVSDSTVDFHNWDGNGQWTGWASEDLRRALDDARVTSSVVDAVCGSGFVARAHVGEHFHARLSYHLRSSTPHGTRVVLVGGWNDAGSRVQDVCAAVRGCANLVHRYA